MFSFCQEKFTNKVLSLFFGKVLVKWYRGDIMTIKVQIGLRVTEEIRDKLYEEAENQNRSVNNLIEHIIAKYFKEKEEKEEK